MLHGLFLTQTPIALFLGKLPLAFLAATLRFDEIG